jgi:hypothetical protein
MRIRNKGKWAKILTSYNFNWPTQNARLIRGLHGTALILLGAGVGLFERRRALDYLVSILEERGLGL